jgi:hypothetical protein
MDFFSNRCCHVRHCLLSEKSRLNGSTDTDHNRQSSSQTTLNDEKQKKGKDLLSVTNYLYQHCLHRCCPFLNANARCQDRSKNMENSWLAFSSLYLYSYQFVLSPLSSISLPLILQRQNPRFGIYWWEWCYCWPLCWLVMATVLVGDRREVLLNGTRHLLGIL